jgi:hypothetical protein
VTSTRRRLSAVVVALLGLALFVYAVRRTGVDEILGGIGRVGWGLIPILALGGARFLLRSECWRLCLPPEARLTFRQAFVAFVAGDAVGSVTPLGLLASEPTKVLLTRHHLATVASVSSLAFENLVYAASVLAMIATGAVVMLATVSLPSGWTIALAGGLLALVAGSGVALFVLRNGLGGRRQLRPAWREKVTALRQELRSLSRERRAALARAFLLDLVYHALAVLEVFLTLEWLLGARSPTLAQAVVFEALNRVVTVAFKFVPFRVGVDEALTGALAPILTVNVAAGVTLAVVRKVRSLFWAAIGLIFVAAHPTRSAR